MLANNLSCLVYHSHQVWECKPILYIPHLMQKTKVGLHRHSYNMAQNETEQQDLHVHDTESRE